MKRPFTKFILDPETPFKYMRYDYVPLDDLRDYIRRHEEDTPRTDAQNRVKLIVRYSLDVMKQRLTEAMKEFEFNCPDVVVLGFGDEDAHLDEEILARYFIGQIAGREMRELEEQCRYCPECGWRLIGVGRVLTGYGLLFGIERVINPSAVRTLHLSRAEIDDWLDRRQSREVRREILGHLKICRRCHQWMREEAEDNALESGLITRDSVKEIDRMPPRNSAR